jgi:LPS sulfotransferase NodH
MKERILIKVHRRDLLRFAIASTAAATTGTLAIEAVAAEPTGSANKRKSRYQANSAEVQDFYRVNSYPAR